MAGKKRSASAAKPKAKRRRSSRKNPIRAGEAGSTNTIVTGKKSKTVKSLQGLVKPPRDYLSKAEIAAAKRKLEAKIRGARKPRIKASSEELSALDALFPPQVDANGQIIGTPFSALVFGGTAEIEKYKKLKKKLQEAKSKADAAQAKRIARAINKVDDTILALERSDETLDSAENIARYKYLLANLSKLDEANIVRDGWKESDLDRSLSQFSESDFTDDYLKVLEKQLRAEGTKVSKADLVKALVKARAEAGEGDVEELIEKLSNPRRRKGMAKKRKSKAKYSRRRKGKKVGAKVGHRKKRRKSKKSAALAALLMAAGGKKKRRKGKKAHHKRAHKSRRHHKRRNPISFIDFVSSLKGKSAADIAKQAVPYVAAAGGAALVVAGVTMFAKKVPQLKKAMEFSWMGFNVGQMALAGLVGTGLIMGSRKAKGKLGDAMALVGEAAILGLMLNAGMQGAQIAARQLKIPGMAGVEPSLMGIEPSMMGDADFGDADFGDADFGEVQMYGAEPVLMGNADYGSADFGAIQQYSGYGDIQQYSGYGDIQQYSGDEDFAGAGWQDPDIIADSDDENFDEDADGSHLG